MIMGIKKIFVMSLLLIFLPFASFSDDIKELSNFYNTYMIVKNCNKISWLYIDDTSMESAKQYIKNIEDSYLSTNDDLNTDKIWQQTSEEFDRKYGDTFRLMEAFLDAPYSEDFAALCNLNFMTLNLSGQNTKDKNEKDF